MCSQGRGGWLFSEKRTGKAGEGDPLFMCEGVGVSKRNTTRLETRTKESSGAASRRLNESQ